MLRVLRVKVKREATLGDVLEKLAETGWPPIDALESSGRRVPMLGVTGCRSDALVLVGMVSETLSYRSSGLCRTPDYVSVERPACSADRLLGLNAVGRPVRGSDHLV